MRKYSKNDLIVLQKFVDTIDNEIVVDKSDRYECDPLNKEVFVSNKDYEELDYQFLEWFQEQPEFTEMNIVLLSILHEIGHCMTYQEQRNEQRDTIENMLVFMFEQGAITEKEMNFAYFSIECERLATMWGVEYFKNNRKKCLELAEMLGL